MKIHGLTLWALVHVILIIKDVIVLEKILTAHFVLVPVIEVKKI